MSQFALLTSNAYRNIVADLDRWLNTRGGLAGPFISDELGSFGRALFGRSLKFPQCSQH